MYRLKRSRIVKFFLILVFLVSSILGVATYWISTEHNFYVGDNFDNYSSKNDYVEYQLRHRLESVYDNYYLNQLAGEYGYTVDEDYWNAFTNMAYNYIESVNNGVEYDSTTNTSKKYLLGKTSDHGYRFDLKLNYLDNELVDNTYEGEEYKYSFTTNLTLYKSYTITGTLDSPSATMGYSFYHLEDEREYSADYYTLDYKLGDHSAFNSEAIVNSKYLVEGLSMIGERTEYDEHIWEEMARTRNVQDVISSGIVYSGFLVYPGDNYVKPIMEIQITEYILDDAKFDYYDYLEIFFSVKYDIGYYSGIIIVLFGLISILSFVGLVSCTGYKRNSPVITMNKFDRIPTELIILVSVGLTALGLYLYEMYKDDIAIAFENNFIPPTYFYIQSLLYIIVLSVIIGISLRSLIVRIKTKNVIKTSVIYIVSKYINEKFNIAKLTRSIPAEVYIAMLIILFIATLVLNIFYPFTHFIEKVLIYALLIVTILSFRKIFNALKILSSGDLSYKINTKKMIGPLKAQSERINFLGESLTLAIDEKLKSERLKAELITNVSHDIKTPLTSIINYTDLLEKEMIKNEKAKDYIEIISKHSARLKKLIEDLVHVSKVNSGNIKVDYTTLNVNLLLTQALSEYEDRFKLNNLEIITRYPQESCYISADSRIMWRIIDNLLSNIVKYSLSDSRVYVHIEKLDGEVTMIFKNISNTRLDIGAEELVERFVRADSSRHTEGSGLGLSIAKSLTVIQNGIFEINIDGDLFKAIVRFNAEDNIELLEE